MPYEDYEGDNTRFPAVQLVTDGQPFFAEQLSQASRDLADRTAFLLGNGRLVLADAVEGTDLGHHVVNGWEDVPGSTLTLTALAGDNVFVDALAFLQATGSGIAIARIVITDTAGTYTTTAGTSAGVLTTQTGVVLKTFKKALAAGTVTVKLQLQNGAPGTNDARMTTFLVELRQLRP